MRRGARGMSTLHRRRRWRSSSRVVGVYLGFTKSIPFRAALRGQGGVQEREQPAPGSPVRIAGVEVGKVTEGRARARGDKRRGRDDAHPGQGPAAAQGRALQDPPAHLPRGQLLRRRHARAPRAPSSADSHTFPVQQTDTPVQLDQVLDRAADRHARGPQDAAATSTPRGLEGKGAQGFNRSIEYWKPAYRDSAIVSEATLGEKRARPLGLHRPAPASWRARSTATPSSSRR